MNTEGRKNGRSEKRKKKLEWAEERENEERNRKRKGQPNIMKKGRRREIRKINNSDERMEGMKEKERKEESKKKGTDNEGMT